MVRGGRLCDVTAGGRTALHTSVKLQPVTNYVTINWCSLFIAHLETDPTIRLFSCSYSLICPIHQSVSQTHIAQINGGFPVQIVYLFISKAGLLYLKRQLVGLWTDLLANILRVRKKNHQVCHAANI